MGQIIQAYGSYKAGQAYKAEGKSEQKIANYNAALAERQAEIIGQRTTFAQIRQAQEASRIRGSLMASMGASGISPSTSGAAVLAKQAKESELENLLIGYEGMTEAAQARSQAELDRMQGSLAKQRAKAKK